MDKTNEFSFIIKPAKHGVGVFATHDIKTGTHLRLFVDEDTAKYTSRIIAKKIYRNYFTDTA